MTARSGMVSVSHELWGLLISCGEEAGGLKAIRNCQKLGSDSMFLRALSSSPRSSRGLGGFVLLGPGSALATAATYVVCWPQSCSEALLMVCSRPQLLRIPFLK